MRYPDLATDALTEEQCAVVEKITAKQPNLTAGPYGAMVHAPVVAGLVYELDTFLTEGLLVPERLRVIAELTAAAKHRPEDVYAYIAFKHIPTGFLSQETIDAIAAGNTPISTHDDENLVYEFVSELIHTGRVGNDCFDRACAAFGREICLELVKVAGFAIFFNGMAGITERKRSISAV